MNRKNTNRATNIGHTTLSMKIYRWQRNAEKEVPQPYALSKCKLKPQPDTTTYLSLRSLECEGLTGGIGRI